MVSSCMAFCVRRLIFCFRSVIFSSHLHKFKLLRSLPKPLHLAFSSRIVSPGLKSARPAAHDPLRRKRVTIEMALAIEQGILSNQRLTGNRMYSARLSRLLFRSLARFRPRPGLASADEGAMRYSGPRGVVVDYSWKRLGGMDDVGHPNHRGLHVED